MGLLGELRFAARRLWSDRWSAAAAIMVAALGAGLNTAVFAVAYGVLLRPLPYTDADRLVVIDADVPFPQIADWRRQLPALERVSGYARDRFTVRGAGEPHLAAVAVVDDEFFATLGGTPAEGRPFEHGGETAVAVVSERFARAADGSGTLLGRTVTVGLTPVTIVAIMPAAFAFPSELTDLWMPARAAPAIAFDRSPDARRYNLVGRLRPGATVPAARADVTRARLALEPPGDRRAADPIVQSLDATLTGSSRPVLGVFAVGAAIVLIIACANVASILIGRTLARRRELAVRRALGASPSRLFVSVLSESMVIAAAGVGAGMLVAVTAVRAVERWAAGILPRLGDIRLDWTVLLFACGIAALSAMFGALPAIRAIRAGAVSLRAGGAGEHAAGRTRGALIVIQIGLAVVLLTSGALLMRTLSSLLRGDAGIDTRGTIVSQLMLTETTRFDAAGRGPLLAELLRRVRALPGVSAAGVGTSLPPENGFMEVRVRLVDGAEEIRHSLSLGATTPGYLQAIGARLLAGRHFEDRDARPDHPAVVISASAARALMGGLDAVGRDLPVALPMLRDRGHPTVIGVVSDIKYAGLEGPAGPTIYVMWTELPAGQAFLAVRTSAASTPAAVASILRELDPGMPIRPARMLEDVLQRSVADRRLRALLVGSIACLAFAVALVGLAGGLVRVVSERRYELAIRAALGATPAHAVRIVMMRGALLSGAGLAVGIAGALAAGRALASMLHGVSAHDPLTLAIVAAIVSALTLGACYVPARRAARIDPLEILRGD